MQDIAIIDFRNGTSGAKYPRAGARLAPDEGNDDMDILELLTNDEDAIVAEALAAVTWLEHYERDGEDVARDRLRALCRLVAGAIRTQDLAGLVGHAERIARERHAAGYDRAEVVSAFSAVEEAIWHRTLSAMPAADRTWALGLVGTALDPRQGRAGTGLHRRGRERRPRLRRPVPSFPGVRPGANPLR